MAGASKASRNASRHEVDPRPGDLEEADESQVRKATLAILHLEQVIDAIRARMLEAEGDEFVRLANSLSLAATALFNGHRTVRYLTGGRTPMEQALRELKGLDFSED